MQMVSMRMGHDDGIKPGNPDIEQLFAHVRRRIDEDGFAAAFDEQRRASAAVARVIGVAGPPIGTDRRYAGRRPAAQHSDLHAGALALANRRKKFVVVAAASASISRPFSVATKAAVAATNAGSLRLPRYGIGARYGASVSTSSRSSGVIRAASRTASDVLNVITPPNAR